MMPREGSASPRRGETGALLDDRGRLDLDHQVRLAQSKTTPIRRIGLTGSMPSFAAARATPSPSSGYFSALQSTTYTVSFATSSNVPPAAVTAVATLSSDCSTCGAKSLAPTGLPSARDLPGEEDQLRSRCSRTVELPGRRRAWEDLRGSMSVTAMAVPFSEVSLRSKHNIDMYSEAMVRTKDPRVRSLLIERAAEMLAAREAVTTRSLVTVPVSTMAVYTYFGGLPGLWSALRQKGFTRLAAMVAEVRVTQDPVRDLAALAAAYIDNAVANPEPVPRNVRGRLRPGRPGGGGRHAASPVMAVERAKEVGRFRSDVDPLQLATQTWLVGHGPASLVTSGPLPRESLALTGPILVADVRRGGRRRETLSAGGRAGVEAARCN